MDVKELLKKARKNPSRAVLSKLLNLEFDPKYCENIDIKKALLELAERIKRDDTHILLQLVKRFVDCFSFSDAIQILSKLIGKIDLENLIDFLEDIAKYFEDVEINKVYSELKSKNSPLSVILLPILKHVDHTKEFIDFLKKDEMLEEAFLIFPFVENLINKMLVISQLKALIEERKEIIVSRLSSLLVPIFYISMISPDTANSLIKQIYPFLKSRRNLFLKSLAFTPNLIEAKAILWIMVKYPEIFEPKKAVRSIILSVKNHKEKIILEASEALIAILQNSNNEYRKNLIKMLSRSKIDELRLLATHIAAEHIYDSQYRNILRKLAIDRKSAIRKAAASYLLDYLNFIKDKDELIKTISYLILSGHASTIKNTLELISTMDLERDDIILILKKVAYDYRTSTINAILKIIETYLDQLNLVFVISTLLNILEKVQNKKNISEQILDFIDLILTTKGDKKLLQFVERKLKSSQLKKEYKARIIRRLKSLSHNAPKDKENQAE